MPLLSTVTIAAAAVWLALVVAAQVLTPEQSPLSMGMSGLATGRHGWAMKAAFVARGFSACALAAALPGALYPGWRLTSGFVLLWVWGVGSVLLALFDTDMPGDRPSRHGQAHVLIALVAYLAAAASMLVVSRAVLDAAGGAGIARLALPVTLVAMVFLLLQSMAFGQAARAAAYPAAGAVADEVSGAADGLSAGAGATSTPAPAQAGVPAGASAAPAPAGSTAGAPASPAPVGAPAAPAASTASADAAGGAPVSPARTPGLGGYAGLLQRVFVGLVMVWTVIVAVAI